MISPMTASQPGMTAVEAIEAATSRVQRPVSRYPMCSPMPTPSSRLRVANTNSIERRVEFTFGPICGDVATGQLGNSERPAYEAERLDERSRHPDHEHGGSQRGGRGKDYREKCHQRQHRERTPEERLPSQDKPSPAGGETPEYLVRLLTEDVRVVEDAPEFKEGNVEGDRHGDQKNRRDQLDAHSITSCRGWGSAVTQRSYARAAPLYRRPHDQVALVGGHPPVTLTGQEAIAMPYHTSCVKIHLKANSRTESVSGRGLLMKHAGLKRWLRWLMNWLSSKQLFSITRRKAIF